MSALIPDRLFVNVYPPSIGPCIGSAYMRKEDADRYANSHRMFCLELSARPTNSVIVSDECRAMLDEMSASTGLDPSRLITAALCVRGGAVALDPHPEVKRAIEAYAGEHGISVETACQEALRAYFVEAAAQ